MKIWGNRWNYAIVRKGPRLGPGGASGALLQQPTRMPPEEGRASPTRQQRERGKGKARSLEPATQGRMEPTGARLPRKRPLSRGGGTRGAKGERFGSKPRLQPLQWFLERGPCPGVEGVAAGIVGVSRHPSVAAYPYTPQWGKFEPGKLAKGEGQWGARDKQAGSRGKAR